MIEQLRIVEIELFSYCNRTCDWCPNKYINRRTWQYLDLDLLSNVLFELSQHNYSGVFSFSRYNEPFADYERLSAATSMIQEMFPCNRLVSNTNGDYLTEDILQNTLIDELTIMDYDCKGREWVRSRLQNWHCENICEYDKYFTAIKSNTKILYYPNWPELSRISDRGGELSKYSSNGTRNDPCYEPQYFCGINYDGTVSPCCNVRNDGSNAPLILGDLHQDSLERILTNDKATAFRQSCKQSHFPMFCQHCSNSGGRYTTKNGMLDL